MNSLDRVSRTSVGASLVMFVVVVAAGVLLTLPSIHAPFFWDDLHLIRVHTPAELSASWTGPFDSDHIETPGFRPLTNYFNHLRALAFGDSTAAQRVFLLILFGVFLALTGVLARWFFNAGMPQMVLGGLVGLLHIYSVYHYFWISDGVHLLLGFFVLGSCLSLLQALRSGRRAWLLLCMFCAAMALLTREDALVLYPLLLYLGAGFACLHRREITGPRRLGLALALFAVGMLAELGVYWYWRGRVVPDAAPLSADARALVWGLSLTVQNVGGSQVLANPWPTYEIILRLWDVWLAGFALAIVFLLKRAGRRAALFWAGAVLMGVLPILVVARANLILLSVAFWGLLVAGVLVEAWRNAQAWWLRGLALLMISVALVVPAYGSFAFERELRPANINWMCRNADLLYGVTGNATIPPSVRALVQADLSAFGINSLADFESKLPALERKAQADGRYGFNAQGLSFIPRFQFLPQFGLHPHCEPPG